MRRICSDCADLINRWVDAFQDMGPITRWQQYQTSPAGRLARSTEMFSIRVEERAELIRRQVAAIRANCDHEEAA